MRTHHFLTRHVFTRVLFSVFAIFIGISNSPSQAVANAKYAGIVMDAKTGRILYSHKSNEKRYPASLTKMMTLYMVFEALETRKITKKTRVRFSKYSASKPPSKLGIKPGRSISMEQAIYALVTKSANDVAAAVGETLAGSESNFAARMTKRARQLGMSKTTFRNASGLTAKGQITTARDMATLGIALREHYPSYYKYFSTRKFRFGKKKYGNHNKLLGRVKGVDGIKTGYTRPSGFNLVTSVRHKNRSIVAVVLGGRSGKSRNAQMKKLISKYLRKATQRSKSRLLVAKLNQRPANILVASALKLPKRGPIPVFREQYADPGRLRIEEAHVASVAYLPQPALRNPKSVDAIKVKLLTMASAVLPSKRPPRPTDPVTTATVRPSQNITSKATSSAVPTGWQIQIAAVPSQNDAVRMLNSTRNKYPSLLSSTDNYLQKITKNGQILYRARYAGFNSKNLARKICNKMKKRKISCLAIKG